MRGVTPNFHTQTDIMPFAVNVPIACGGVLVMPGDIIVADDDGAAVVPVALAGELIEQAHARHEWEDFYPRAAVGGRRPAPLLSAHRRGPPRVRGVAQAAGDLRDRLGANTRKATPDMKITDLKCAVIGKNPVVRIVTDEGISGYGEVEQYKPYLKPFILHFRDALIGADPTNVERVMLRIRQRGAFKPWGSAVSAIEMALLGHRRQGGRPAGLQAARRQGARPRARLQRRRPLPLTGYEPGGLRREGMAR